MSLPVVSSNTGGLPEVNIHNKTGFLCNVGDIESMSDLSIALLKDEAMLSQFKKQAKEQALRYNIKAILPLYEDLYSSVMKVHRQKVG